MKRISLLVILVFTVIFAMASLNVNWAKLDDHTIHNRSKLTPTVNGAISRAAIPDQAALEIVLRLLASKSLSDGNKRAYLALSGLDDAASAILFAASHDYKRVMADIEKKADDIKNASWPTPDSNALKQLADLQYKKENTLAGLATDLEARLHNFHAHTNWQDHIANRVKARTKGFQVGLPPNKIGLLRFTDLFAAYAQAPGCDPTVYIYSDTYFDTSSFQVVGCTSYSVPSNNCGHTFTPTTNTSSYSGPGGTGSDGVVLDLLSWDGTYYFDGDFFTNSDVDAFCPVVSQTFDAGNNASNTTVAPFISVGQFTNWRPSGNISVNTQALVDLPIIGSTDSGGKSFTASAGYDIVAGSFDLEVSGGGNFVVPSNPGSKKTTLLFGYKPTAISTSPARFQARVDVSSSQVTVYKNPAVSAIKTIVP